MSFEIRILCFDQDDPKKCTAKRLERFGFSSNYKSFRTWSGIRPLVKPRKINQGLPLSRSHRVIDHEPEGLKNFLTICGGALTTHRLMAEDVVNKLGNKFGLNIKCSSHITPLVK